MPSSLRKLLAFIISIDVHGGIRYVLIKSSYIMFISPICATLLERVLCPTVDVWDGEDGNPIIYHGHTLTSKITLADVLNDAIKRWVLS